MKIRISNTSSGQRTVYLEPLGEDRVLEKGAELYINMEYTSADLSVSETPEFRFSDSSITIYYTSDIVVDWAD